MGILDNGIIKYAFDNNKGKNDIEEYKKLLFKYKQVLDWYRQDLQDYNYMFLTRDEKGKIHLNEKKLHFEDSSESQSLSQNDSITKEDIREAFESLSFPQYDSITKEDIREVFESLSFPQYDGITKEDIREAFESLSFPQYDGVTKEDIREVFESLSFPQYDGITKEDIKEAFDLHEVTNSLDIIYGKLEKIDNSFSDYVYSDPVFPDFEADFETINHNFEKLETLISSNSNQNNDAISITLYQIEEKLTLLDNVIRRQFEILSAKQDESINKNSNDDVLLKINELNQKLIHVSSDINTEMNKKLTENFENIERKLESIAHDNSFANRKLVTILSISTILNVISVGLLLYFIF